MLLGVKFYFRFNASGKCFRCGCSVYPVGECNVNNAGTGESSRRHTTTQDVTFVTLPLPCWRTHEWRHMEWNWCHTWHRITFHWMSCASKMHHCTHCTEVMDCIQWDKWKATKPQSYVASVHLRIHFYHVDSLEHFRPISIFRLWFTTYNWLISTCQTLHNPQRNFLSFRLVQWPNSHCKTTIKYSIRNLMNQTSAKHQCRFRCIRSSGKTATLSVECKLTNGHIALRRCLFSVIFSSVELSTYFPVEGNSFSHQQHQRSRWSVQWRLVAGCVRSRKFCHPISAPHAIRAILRDHSV